MTKISNFGKQNSTLGSVVPLAMFLYMIEEPVEYGCHEETVEAKNDQNKPNKEQTSCKRPAEKDIDNLLS